MCLIVFAWRPGHAVPLVLAANRDEFYARPALALGPWEKPGVYAGRDLQAGGTWLGIGPQGRFAALTNIRDPQQPLGRRSRGELVADFLQGEQSPMDYLQEVLQGAADYAGFNLLVGDGQDLMYANSHLDGPIQVTPGLHGLSNAVLNTPWPKLERARAGLGECLEQPDLNSLLALLRDTHQASDAQLPNTGVGLDLERLLSSVFIASPDYGTRASTVLIQYANGRRELVERSFAAEGPLGEVRLSL